MLNKILLFLEGIILKIDTGLLIFDHLIQSILLEK